MTHPEVIFIKVQDNQSKLMKICGAAAVHFQQGESMLLSVQDRQAADYLDQLLWKFSEESFLPHAIIGSASNERIGIAVEPVNYNQAEVLFNLCSSVCPIYGQFKKVYELEDQTHYEKAELTKKKLAFYTSAKIPIVFA